MSHSWSTGPAKLQGWRSLTHRSYERATNTDVCACAYANITLRDETVLMRYNTVCKAVCTMRDWDSNQLQLLDYYYTQPSVWPYGEFCVCTAHAHAMILRYMYVATGLAVYADAEAEVLITC